MKNIFFSSKWFLWCLPLFFIFEVFSFIANDNNILGNTLFILIVLITFGLSLYRLPLGLMIAFSELTIGSQGHLFNLIVANQEIGIRLGIFCAIILAWCVGLVRFRRTNIFSVFNFKWFLILGFVVLWSLIFGLIRHNGLINIYSDFNAWLFFLYLGPAVDGLTSKDTLKPLISVISAGIAWTVLKSMGLLYYFSHNFSAIKPVYRWVRDTGIGEITLLSGSFYRIFFQSHIYTGIGFFIILSLLFLINSQLRPTKSNLLPYIAIIALTAVSILNLSRSNWVGLLLTGFIFLIIFLYLNKHKIKRGAGLIINLMGILIVSVAALLAVIYFPWPNLPAINPSEMLKDRINLNESAVSSRWSQLPNLAKSLTTHPVIGSGFGSTVTYTSLDPRVLEKNPTGEYTTYAFEWGYLDIILKIGLFGLFIYLGLLISIGKKTWSLIRTSTQDNAWLLYGFLLGLIFLSTVHAFSPYLNHPLGIGYIIFLTAVLQLFSQSPTEKTHQKSS
ncbi:TPA: hypothetical protein DF272_03670 [Candidatus Falkowbacteria bacterium]|nr:hypothetical protein [Candidatus Falkowbacteria bacterium]